MPAAVDLVSGLRRWFLAHLSFALDSTFVIRRSSFGSRRKLPVASQGEPVARQHRAIPGQCLVQRRRVFVMRDAGADRTDTAIDKGNLHGGVAGLSAPVVTAFLAFGTIREGQ